MLLLVADSRSRWELVVQLLTVAKAASEPATGKLPGLHRYQNAVLRRGVIGSLGLYKWIDDVRHGGPATARGVGIALLDEGRTEVASWNLTRAWPVRYQGPTLNASTSHVAVEELVLTYESPGHAIGRAILLVLR